jgi:hypothetical protein
MYETLAAGVANRTVTTQDLNIPDPPEGADPQRAAGFHPLGPSVVIAVAPSSEMVVGRGVGIVPLDPVRTQAKAALAPVRGSHGRGGSFPVASGSRTVVLLAAAVDAALEDLGALSSLLSPDGGHRASHRGKVRGSGSAIPPA